MFLPCPALKINCSFTRFENHCSVVHLKKKRKHVRCTTHEIVEVVNISLNCTGLFVLRKVFKKYMPQPATWLITSAS